MNLKGKGVYVLTPMYGGNLSVNYHHSFLQLVQMSASAGVVVESDNVYNESLISRARNRLVDTFLKETSHEYACFIDADIGFDPRDVFQMMSMDKPILGVPCSKKSFRWKRIEHAIARRFFDWLRKNPQLQGMEPEQIAMEFTRSAMAFAEQDLPRIGGDFVLNLLLGQKDVHIDTEPGKTFEVRHLGTGFLLVKREVFEKFMKAYPDRWYKASNDPASNVGRIHDFFKCGVNPETREYDSEDYWFIHDCIAMGYKALICPWVKTTHMGTYSFVGDMPAALATSGLLF